MNPNIFRKYDIRGIADRDLTDEAIDLIGKAFASFLVREQQDAVEEGADRKSVVLGRDIRPSSERIFKALSKSLMASGISVTDIGIVTTPVCYFSVNHFRQAGCIMITGSHNPPEYNGLKLVIGKKTIFGDDIQRIKVIAENQEFMEGKGTLRQAEIIGPYQDHIKKSFQFKRRLKVVIDSGNGTAGLVAPKLLKDLGHDVIELFSEPDSRFPNHHPDPTVEENLHDLIREVRNQRADCGLAFDGDADRIGVIDDCGNIIWGDKLLILFSRAILKVNPGATFIADVKCSHLFFEDVHRHGGKAVMWKTGHSFIKQKLKEIKAALGGEMSGHMFFADRYFGFDDGIYAGVRVLEILDQTGKKISELLNDVPKTFSTPEIRVDCPDEEKFQVVTRVTQFFKSRYPTSDIDGVRIDFGDGWGLARASNTQPVLVTRFEAITEKRLKEIQKLVESKIAEFSRKG